MILRFCTRCSRPICSCYAIFAIFAKRIICGFICAAADLANWNPLEIWGLVNGTKDYYGSLEHFVPAYTKDDIRNFTKMSLNNLYHEL